MQRDNIEENILIKNPQKLRKFEYQLARKNKANFYKNLAIVEELHREARNLGVFGVNPLEGLEVDIKLTRIINHVRRTSYKIIK